MANNKQKLELTWIGKNNPEYDISNIEPRILEENPKLSNCKNNPNTENMIIHGDNLLALKALLPEYEGKIKCIYIDPPYNTGNAFEHYDDSVEHSTWLSLMKPRLELLRKLLRDDGVVFLQIDDKEQPYLKIICDETFGRENFISMISVKMSFASGLKATHEENTIFKICEYILVYGKDSNLFRISNLDYIKSKKVEYDVTTRRDRVLLNKEEDINNWVFETVRTLYKKEVGDTKYKEINSFVEKYADRMYTFIENDSSRRYWNHLSESEKIKFKDKVRLLNNPETRYLYAFNEAVLLPYYPEQNDGNLWLDFYNIGRTAESEGGVSFKNGKKPEKLLERIIGLVTNKDDLVLDSFLGSGTTAAVAHKMERKYIGIEMGDHAYTHCKVRMDKVIDGTDQGGISKAVNWLGGGAYKFYELAPSFIVKDEFGNPVIENFYDDTKLIKAMCKLMNFTYKPSKSAYWKHGVGQGKNYLYVTTQLLTSGMVQQIASHLVEGESLIISPKKFEPGAEKIDSRITIKKIPQSVLKACHFGKKEYLLPIKESALEEVDVEEEDGE